MSEVRLIDANALKEVVLNDYDDTLDGIVKFGMKKVLKHIDNAPTVEYPFYAEAYQTGYEEGKGEWIRTTARTYCSNCDYYEYNTKAQELLSKFNFCPNCGADMRKGGAE